MTDDDKLGPINVKMGSGNAVDHIGHKITYESPPPPPNAVFQDGQLIGEFVGEPTLQSGRYVFPLMQFRGAFDEGKEFVVQGARLSFLGCDFVAGASTHSPSRSGS